MRFSSDSGGLLRARDGGEQRVTPLELFFDLVYVFAVTQLSHRLLDHLTIRGALEALLLLSVVWSAWVGTTWVTNWFDPDRLLVRLMLVAVMLASLLMSVAIPEAFGERGLMFAAGYVAIQVGRTAFVLVALGGTHPLSRNFQRVLSWYVASGALWILGGLLEGESRYVLWGLALAADVWGPVTGYWTPGLGRTRTGEWTIEGGHFAERCRLFIIIALGESLLVTGTTFGEIEASTSTVSALVVAFVGSVALWWIYFSRGAEAASEIISSSEDPGRLARSAYTYFHIPMVAGIISVAASDELTVAHPGDPGTPASVALILGGTGLFLAGHALFERAVFGALPWSRVIAIVVLAVLVPAGFVLPAIVLSGAVGLIVVGVAVWDTLAYGGYVRPPRRSIP
jgi:low temperature requirement protein LtrA